MQVAKTKGVARFCSNCHYAGHLVRAVDGKCPKCGAPEGPYWKQIVVPPKPEAERESESKRPMPNALTAAEKVITDEKAAVEAARASGVVSEKRIAAYVLLLAKGPLTAREIDAALGPSGHKRVSELARQGLARRLMLRTGLMQDEPGWEAITGVIPTALPKRSLRDKAKAGRALRSFIARAKKKGVEPDPVLLKLGAWLDARTDG